MLTRTSILLASVLLLGIAAPLAHAEIPSVDAYGGEALVLGKPHHHSRGAPDGGAGTSRSSGSRAGSFHGPNRSGNEANGAVGATPSGRSGGSGGSGGTATGGTSGTSGSHAPQAPRPHGSLATGSTSGQGQAGGGTDGGASRTGASGSGTRAGQDLAYAYPTATTRPSGASALSTGNVLLILAGLLCVVGVGVVLRRARRIA